MNEVVGGVLVMAVFVGFVIWKNRGKPKRAETMQDRMNEQWWAEREQERKEGPLIVRAGSDDQDDDDD
ncbi:MAG: hypothetical protein K9K79_12600 [Desulfohalobiaceae bacterium]|nr:hypothetical protein [Desulfohalobiaceae bacterium]